jgi:YbbR domain-containing protein
MFRWISANYRTLLWAFALAMAVWISAVTSADPDETRTLASPVPLQIVGQDPSLILNSDIPKEVEITLRAPRSVWNLIEADPQIVRANLDLSGLSSGIHELNPQIQVNARPVQIESFTPHTITLTLEAISTQTLLVDLSVNGEAAVGYQMGKVNIDPLKVVVAGAQSQVQKVKRARVSINVSGIRENFDQSIAVEILDQDSQHVNAITVSPEFIHVTIPVSQQGGYRDVAVKVVVTGRVASGYRLTDISVFPPIVTVFAGDSQLVNALPGVVETQPLDLQNAQEDITTRLSLNLPEGISIVGDQTVLIQAGVSPIESSITLAGEHVEIIGLSNGFSAKVSPLTVDVIVSGPLPLLDTLTRQDVRVTVDLTGLNAGTHQITPKVEVLISNVIVESILPNTIEVVIAPGSMPTMIVTPTP